MDAKKGPIENHFNEYVPETLAKHASEGFAQLTNTVNHLIQTGNIPENGLDKLSIQFVLNWISHYDSNNYLKNVAVGEREARIYSDLVSQRHYGLGHGVGRSGDLNEVQPKAVGSSLLYKLTNKMALNALKLSNMACFNECIVVPMATGMTLALCMRALSKDRSGAKYVVWPRIDQKSCFKSILTAGFTPLIIENKLVDTQIMTDLDGIKKAIVANGPNSIVCVMTTSSCFAPRAPDFLKGVGDICLKYNVPHLLNNAYGVQVFEYAQMITKTMQSSRLDLVVQSTDKNFMVPVGGSIVATHNQELLKVVASTYAGRASISPTLDLFITLLEMGSNKYKELLDEQKKNFAELCNIVTKISEDFGLEFLKSPNNKISLALSLNKYCVTDISVMGRRLFFRSVSGCRVVELGLCKNIDGYVFKNWGSHVNNYPASYLACAASIGMTEHDLHSFDKRLRALLKTYNTMN